MQVALRKIFQWMPLLFGIGFVAPLIAQTLALWGWLPPYGLSEVVVGLVIGGVWGLIATKRGRWL